jgi:hypothetical protein
MTIDVSPVPREETLALRDLYRKEMERLLGDPDRVWPA